MAQQTINVGTSPNDGTGTPLRTAFQYTNSNFSELYTAVGPSGNNIVVPGNATITGDLTVRTNTISATSTGVGFGITTAAAAIDVVSSFQWRSNVAGTDKLAMFSGGAGLIYLGSTTASALGFLYNGSEAMRLNSTGLGVGLNPSSYAGRLVVGGTPAATSGAIVYVRDTFANGSNNSLGSIMFASSPGFDFYVGKKVSSGVSWFSIGNANSGAEYFQIDSSGNVISNVTGTAPTLGVNSQMVFNLTSNTNLRISVRGTDGVTRVANITLA